MRRLLFAILLFVCWSCDDRRGKQSPPAMAATRPSPGHASGTLSFERRNIVTLTPIAASKVRELSGELNLEATAYLRVGVEPSIPPQFRYLLDITEAVEPQKDLLGESQSVRIVVDRNSSVFLMGTTIDYRSTPEGSGFWFENPNAKSRSSTDKR